MKNKNLDQMLQRLNFDSNTEEGFIILNDEQADSLYGGWDLGCDVNCTQNNNCNFNCNPNC